MKNNLKTLTIKIEYETFKDFRVAMDKIVIDMNRGILSRVYNGSAFDIRNTGTDKHLMEHFRIEEINGKECLVIPSKMNHKYD